jgi:hypothetical protein
LLFAAIVLLLRAVLGVLPMRKTSSNRSMEKAAKSGRQAKVRYLALQPDALGVATRSSQEAQPAARACKILHPPQPYDGGKHQEDDKKKRNPLQSCCPLGGRGAGFQSAPVFADIYPIRDSEQFYENVYRPDLCVTPPTNAPGALVVAGDSIPWGRSVVPNVPRRAVPGAIRLNPVHLAIAGCVNYRYPGDTKIHQTGLYYALVRTDPQWSLDFDPQAGTIKAENLRLERVAAGEYAN